MESDEQIPIVLVTHLEALSRDISPVRAKGLELIGNVLNEMIVLFGGIYFVK